MRRPEFIARQASRPHGVLGRLLARVMAIETAALNDEALELLALRATDRLLEVGFGHGRTIRRAAMQVPWGFVAGVDISNDMVRMARRRCSDLLGKGLVGLSVGDGRSLPEADHSFDKALCVHTIYFWKEPANNLHEIFRVLKPNGQLVLGFRAKSATGSAADFPASVYTFYSTHEVRALLRAAGFVKIDMRNARALPGEMFLATAQRP